MLNIPAVKPTATERPVKRSRDVFAADSPHGRVNAGHRPVSAKSGKSPSPPANICPYASSATWRSRRVMASARKHTASESRIERADGSAAAAPARSRFTGARGSRIGRLRGSEHPPSDPPLVELGAIKLAGDTAREEHIQAIAQRKHLFDIERNQ